MAEEMKPANEVQPLLTVGKTADGGFVLGISGAGKEELGRFTKNCCDERAATGPRVLGS